MPGGPVAAGDGIGANAPKSKLAGVFMVGPFYPALFTLPSHIFILPLSQVRFRRVRWYPLWL
jgi:hypothetical protein